MLRCSRLLVALVLASSAALGAAACDDGDPPPVHAAGEGGSAASDTEPVDSSINKLVSDQRPSLGDQGGAGGTAHEITVVDAPRNCVESEVQECSGAWACIGTHQCVNNGWTECLCNTNAGGGGGAAGAPSVGGSPG